MSHAGSCLGFICTCKTEDALKRSDQYHDVEVQKFIQIIELLKAENATLRLSRDSWQKEAEANEEWAVELKAENARVWELHNDFLNNKMTSLQKETHVLRAENARYREALDKAEKALKFYRREFD